MSYIPQATLQKLQILNNLSPEDFDSICNNTIANWLQSTMNLIQYEIIAGKLN